MVIPFLYPWKTGHYTNTLHRYVGVQRCVRSLRQTVFIGSSWNMVTMLNISTKFERTALNWLEIYLITDVHALSQTVYIGSSLPQFWRSYFGSVWHSCFILINTICWHHYLVILWVGLIATCLNFNISL